MPHTPRSALNLEGLRGFLLAFRDFMIDPGQHTPAYATEGDFCSRVDSLHTVIGYRLITDAIEKGADKCGGCQTVVASNETNVVFIQSKAVLLHDHRLSRAHSHTREATSLQAHAALGTAVLSHATGLNAAAAAEHPLAALVVAPPTARFLMVQRHVPDFVLGAGRAEHGAHPAARDGAGSAAELDLEILLIVGVLSPQITILPPPLFGAQLVTREAEAARHGEPLVPRLY